MAAPNGSDQTVFNLQPILEDKKLLLAPLKLTDFELLYKVASDPAIWEQHQDRKRYTRAGFRSYFDEAMDSKAALKVIFKAHGGIIGSSRFKIIDREAGVVEIGWSFLARDYWGGAVNGAVKKLMVNHALSHFDKVVFYVNKKNIRSQKACEKIGAKKIPPNTAPWVLNEDSKGITYLISSKL